MPPSSRGLGSSAERSAALDHEAHLVGDFQRVLVFPVAKDEPPGGKEVIVGLTIPHLVAVDLVSPVNGVCLWLAIVVGAAMPEATIDVDGNPCGAKHQIGRSTQMREWPV